MIRFGPSGNDAQFYAEGFKSTVDAPKWLSKMGLNALELNFGRGARMKTETAKQIGDEARKYDISVSAHAPYYINLASSDPATVKKSYEYIKQCLEILNAVNASSGKKRVVIHTGFQKELTRDVAMENSRVNLKYVVDKLYADDFTDFLLCIETMGRPKAIGMLDEILDLCKTADEIVPTIDFGHINAIEFGELKRTPKRMTEIMQHVLESIGAKPFHIHFYPAIYRENGEHKHTHLDDEKWAFPFEPLAKFLKANNLSPTIICESENQMARDAVKLKNIYERV